MELFHDATIWVLFSFLIFVGVAFRFAKPAFLEMLDGRIASIKKEIETAESLRVETQELLAQYQRKQRDVAKESDAIIERARQHAEMIRREAEVDLVESMERRTQQLQDRLKNMEKKALQEMQSYAAKLAVQATAEIISETMDKKANSKLLDQSIKSAATHIG